MQEVDRTEGSLLIPRFETVAEAAPVPLAGLDRTPSGLPLKAQSPSAPSVA